VRAKNPGAHPPHLKAERKDQNEVILTYTSPRQLCFLAVGIGRGLGRHFQENLSIKQNRCMHKGDPLCEISFRKAG
jgi:predicted hydrocarbon binding protein